LLKILPSFIKSDGIYVLRGNVSAEDWARFDWYARRIRTFVYRRCSGPGLSVIAKHVYFRIGQLRSSSTTTPLLPFLRHLHCPSTVRDGFLNSGILLLLSPSLQTLHFEKISPIEETLCGTMLDILISNGAQIEKIILDGKGLSGSDTLRMATRFEHLNWLELSGMRDAMSLEIVEAIGSLPGLTKLVLDVTGSRMEPLVHDIGLKVLNSLKIIAPVPFIQTLLSRIAATQLETFAAVVPSIPPADKKEFLTMVVDRWNDTLRRIELVHQYSSLDNTVEHLHIDALAPLIPLQKLTHLKLEGYTMELTDENILSMARAWPEIDTLSLPFINPNRPRPTISSLRFLADHCPNLRHLTIPLNTGDLPLFVSTGVPHTPIHDLNTLTIASDDDFLDLGDLVHIARHVDYLFPKLKSLSPYERRDGGWTKMIRMYQTIRQDAVAFERAKNLAN